MYSCSVIWSHFFKPIMPSFRQQKPQIIIPNKTNKCDHYEDIESKWRVPAIPRCHLAHCGSLTRDLEIHCRHFLIYRIRIRLLTETQSSSTSSPGRYERPLSSWLLLHWASSRGARSKAQRGPERQSMRPRSRAVAQTTAARATTAL